MEKYITYNRLNKQGRLANQIFMVASMYGLSKKSGRKLMLPRWGYREYFKWDESVMDREYRILPELVESDFHWCESFFLEKLKGPQELINIAGYLQSEKYFLEYEEDIREMLSWNEGFKYSCKRGMEKVFEKPVIAIHVRRGDYVSNPNYYQLPLNYYILSLEEEFPDWMENWNVLMFSDDVKWCKTYLEGNNIFYSEGRNDVQDMCLMSQCDAFILSNSSYSWWGAWLSGSRKVVRPIHLFAGELYKTHNTKDFWPENKGWKAYEHEGKKIDLSDCSFNIPVHYDHIDRTHNFYRILHFLQSNFDCEIVVGEQGSREYEVPDVVYMQWEMYEFHRTMMLNQMALKSKGSIIINYDVDVIVPAIQLLQGAKLLRKEEGAVFPYDGRFARIDKGSQHLDFSQLDVSTLKGARPIDPISVGGCIMFSKKFFEEVGMENENFISYGPEDTERVERIEKLGKEIRRVKGTLYHYDHFVGINSSGKNPHFMHNYHELEKIRGMTKKELENYISSWKWLSFAENKENEKEGII